LAIGNPVALEARAEERDTRGFISITTRRPVRGVDGELDVGPAGLDPDGPQHGEGVVAHRLVLAVRQGHLGGHGDRVAGVDAHRVDVLDRADDHGVVGPVAHHLELELLPAEHRLLDQAPPDRAGGQALGQEPGQLLDAAGRCPRPSRRG
jgi:hypothetical protein